MRSNWDRGGRRTNEKKRSVGGRKNQYFGGKEEGAAQRVVARRDQPVVKEALPFLGKKKAKGAQKKEKPGGNGSRKAGKSGRLPLICSGRLQDKSNEGGLEILLGWTRLGGDLLQRAGV